MPCCWPGTCGHLRVPGLSVTPWEQLLPGDVAFSSGLPKLWAPSHQVQAVSLSPVPPNLGLDRALPRPSASLQGLQVASGSVWTMKWLLWLDCQVATVRQAGLAGLRVSACVQLGGRLPGSQWGHFSHSLQSWRVASVLSPAGGRCGKGSVWLRTADPSGFAGRGEPVPPGETGAVKASASARVGLRADSWQRRASASQPATLPAT